MLGEVAQIGIILLIVMVGFTVSLFAIFVKQISYSHVWLDVFQAMLGQVDVFDEFFHDFYGGVAVFLLVMPITLLNLLIAILRTAHAKLDLGQEGAFRVSKVRIRKLYSRNAQNDSQSPPYNLLQLALMFPFLTVDRVFKTSAHGRVKRMAGGFVFWLIMGPLSILALWALSLVSYPSAVMSLWRGYLSHQVSRQLSGLFRSS